MKATVGIHSRLLSFFSVSVDAYMFLFPEKTFAYGEIRPAVRRWEQEGKFPRVGELLVYGIYVGVSMSVIRYFLNRFIFQPFGSWMMKLKKIDNVDPVGELDKLFETSKFLPKEQEFLLGQRTRLSVPQMKSYLKTKRIERLQKLRLWKYTESFWRLLLYTATTVYGVCYLWDKPWTWDVNEYWTGYPLQAVDPALRRYYFFEFGLYLNFFCFQFVDTRRKDFWEMFLHHAVTLGLLLFSYATNFTRIGGVVLCLHDASDVFLESAKLLHYAKAARPACGPPADLAFCLFALVFFAGRLVAYPARVLWAALVGARTHFVLHASYYLWAGLLGALQLLHVYWFALICRLVKRFVVDGIEKDERSITESDVSGPEDGGGAGSKKEK